MSDLKRKILDASIEIIAKEGVRSLSFREVARQAKVSHQAPYHHFQSHQEILKAIAVEGFSLLAENMQKAADKEKTNSFKALNASGIAYVKFARSHLGHFRVMFQKSLMPKDSKNEVLEEAEKAHGVLLRLVEDVAKLIPDKKLNSEQLALMCWSLVHGIASLITEGVVEGANEKKAASEITDMVVGGLTRLLEFKD